MPINDKYILTESALQGLDWDHLGTRRLVYGTAFQMNYG